MIGFASSATRCLLVFAALAPLVGFAAVGSAPAIAHEVRPAYLEFKEEAPDVFDVVFKTPMQGDLRLALTVSVSGESEPSLAGDLAPRGQRHGADLAYPGSRLAGGEERRDFRAGETLSDALLRIEYLDGRSWTQRLTPASPQAIVPAPRPARQSLGPMAHWGWSTS